MEINPTYIVAVVGLIIVCIIFCRRKKTLEPRIVTHEPSKLISPDGSGVAVSVGPEKETLPPTNDHVTVERCSPSSRIYPCSHLGPEWFALNIWGLKSFEFKKNERCAVCEIKRIKKYCIRCAVCGLPICPGDGVALYHNSSPDILPSATVIGDSVLGCMRWNCCPSGGFYAGNWMLDGFVPAFPDNGEKTAATA